MSSQRFPVRVTLHQWIQTDIVNDIIRGVYEKGAIIPNQQELSEKYGVSRNTVRKATDALIRSGTLASVKGKGTFVCDYPENTHQIYGSTTYQEAMAIRRKLSSLTVQISTLSATEAIAKRLCISLGDPVVYIERVRLLEGSPYAFQISYLNQRDIQNHHLTKEQLDNGSLFKLLEEYGGLVPYCQDEELRAVECPERVANYLKMEAELPVILIFRTVYTQDGHVMEYCEDYERTDHKGIHTRTFARHEYEKR